MTAIWTKPTWSRMPFGSNACRPSWNATRATYRPLLPTWSAHPGCGATHEEFAATPHLPMRPRSSNLMEDSMIQVILSSGPALQSIWARDSYAITIARLTFARVHGIAPDDVVVNIEYAAATFQQAPTTQELVIINAV